MSDAPNLRVELSDNKIATLTLNRPEVHNAFDEGLIEALNAALEELSGREVRALVVTGAGKSFSAGADLNYMRRAADASAEENRAQAAAMAGMMRRLDEFKSPTLARVKGVSFGGGVGLVAVCDIAIAEAGAQFSLSEVRLGLAPAVVAPYVIRAIGARAARRYFLTGERFDAGEAMRIGLVHKLAPEGGLDGLRDKLLGELVKGGPNAQAAAKRAVERYRDRAIDAALTEDTIDLIAGLRATDEGREGIAAFLEKRPPGWRG
ncbi:MAG: enoyl-CoA hydratase-related protein [Alphaproteobacteria bacterium]